MEEILKKFRSRRNDVYLIKKDGNVLVRKVFSSESSYNAELYALKILQQINTPKIINHAEFFIDMEYIEGALFLDEFLCADKQKMQYLAKKLVEFINSYTKVRKDYIPGDVNFRNFIIKNNKCYGVDFEESIEGDKATCICKIIAFASLYDIDANLNEVFCQTLLNETGYSFQELKQTLDYEINFLEKRRLLRKDCNFENQLTF